MRQRPQPTIADAAAAPRSRGGDIALIDDVVAQIEAMQWRRDAEGFVGLLTPQAVWVTAFGRRLTGWREIRDFTRSVLTPAQGDEYAFYDVEHITFLSDTIAAVNIRQRPVGPTGEPLHGQAEGRPLYVMSKQEAGWKIAVGQNTKFHATEIAAQQQAIADRNTKTEEYS
ncbi:SgcJ/EcaC family oxidoreductase [Taklimakanibacter albus]|uniref:SgcJ/EcaC family oxidoreductase n=1 Tax=Taklimakanibacter albus TaxID=2800327 RepID=A0ACC5RDV9_9HYPH|nr:SgcJ/EcaC family oxidoreductase [Aestuariivirga sp. YIM B02566]MBK1870845.1 SgcJ/EcaC family oxidoreductase [Aestuariivirga sp. YIM B02566]